MDYSFCQKNQTPYTTEKKRDSLSSEDSFHSITVENPQFEEFIINTFDYFQQQISLSLYAPRTRSYSPRARHMNSEKVLERPKTPLKTLRKYANPEELQGLTDLLKKYNYKKNDQNNEKLPPILYKNSPKGCKSPINGKNEFTASKNGQTNINNNPMFKINFYLNEKKMKDLIKNTNRSDSPEIMRNQIFINSSKMALQNSFEINKYNEKNQLKNEKIQIKNIGLNKFYHQLNINQDQLKLANSIGVRKIQMPNSPPLLLETKRVFDKLVDKANEKPTFFKEQNLF